MALPTRADFPATGRSLPHRTRQAPQNGSRQRTERGQVPFTLFVADGVDDGGHAGLAKPCPPATLVGGLSSVRVLGVVLMDGCGSGVLTHAVAAFLNV